MLFGHGRIGGSLFNEVEMAGIDVHGIIIL